MDVNAARKDKLKEQRKMLLRKRNFAAATAVVAGAYTCLGIILPIIDKNAANVELMCYTGLSSFYMGYQSLKLHREIKNMQSDSNSEKSPQKKKYMRK
ncbi:MAG: hypothetical protein PHX62_09405 [Bacilli bacterium]|nr:hypothetical protein [Bacilli bacterium]